MYILWFVDIEIKGQAHTRKAKDGMDVWHPRRNETGMGERNTARETNEGK